MLATLVVLLFSMLAVGWWVGREIESGVVQRTASTTALYAQTFITPQLQSLGSRSTLSETDVNALDRLLRDTPLGQQIVAFKVWNREGRILFSTDRPSIGQQFPWRSELGRAWRGEVVAGVSDLSSSENLGEWGQFTRLLEFYIPVRLQDTGRVVGVAEFYQKVDDLEGEMAAARWRTWLAVAAGTFAIYLLLVGIVRTGSETIARQQAELSGKIAALRALLAQNEELNERVRRAATRATETNERFLRRISAEVHDGPVQDLSLALMKLDGISSKAIECSPQCALGGDGPAGENLSSIQFSLSRALQGLRSILTGLRLPELEPLTLTDVVTRAVRAHERRTGSKVELEMDGLPERSTLPAKITVYRFIEEGLSNAYRHAGGAGQRVRGTRSDGKLEIEVSDSGPGFDWSAVSGDSGHLGLLSMRERIESLGGVLLVDSSPGAGTRLKASVPVHSIEREVAGDVQEDRA